MFFLKKGERVLQQTLQAKAYVEDGPVAIMARASPIGTRYDFYLTKTIKCDDNVMSLIALLREATPNDQVFIHINSPGGQLKAAAQILTAIRDSQAQVSTCAEGEVYSAASLIFFAGSSFSISEFSNFMVHNASGGAGGDVRAAIKDLENVQEWVEKIYKSVYVPFFSEKEVDDILKSGRDHFFTPEEMAGRIDKVQKNINDSYSRRQKL
jgi:ATP-dependent Clp protease protease subunit